MYDGTFSRNVRRRRRSGNKNRTQGLFTIVVDTSSVCKRIANIKCTLVNQYIEETCFCVVVFGKLLFCGEFSKPRSSRLSGADRSRCQFGFKWALLRWRYVLKRCFRNVSGVLWVQLALSAVPICGSRSTRPIWNSRRSNEAEQKSPKFQIS